MSDYLPCAYPGCSCPAWKGSDYCQFHMPKDRLIEENERLRKALEIYANKDRWSMWPKEGELMAWQIAEQALQEGRDE